MSIALPALIGDSSLPALTDCDAGWTLTHAQLGDAAEALAEQLHELGIQPGDAVATVMENSGATVVTFLALMRASAVAMPLNPQLRRREVEAELSEMRPTLMLIGEGSYDEAVAAASAMGIAVRPVDHGRPPALDGVARARGALADSIRTPSRSCSTRAGPPAGPRRCRSVSATSPRRRARSPRATACATTIAPTA